MALQPGTTLGVYEVTAKIGEGGMGEVYRARDTKLDRDVALKVLPDLFADDPERLARFQREAKVLASLNHPNIASIYGLEESAGVRALVLELVEGPTLAERIAQGAIPIDEALPIVRQIAEALEAAHEAGVIHRDLKPANVKVKADGMVKVLDFGLAKSIGWDAEVTRTAPGTVLGTVAYMSPEQVDGRPLDARSDIFSFGVVLFEALSGRRAFGGETAAQVWSAVLRDDPGPLGAGPALDQVVAECLRKRPADRTKTMAAVRDALDKAAKKPTDQPSSIAVLPFADTSAGKDQEFFSDGLAEEIINTLTHVEGLKVIARTSAFAFKGQNVDIRKIAETLGVTSVLEGSVRRAGNRIRVTVQLIDAGDGSHRWSERYDRELEDVFAIQDEIAQAITSALRTTLSAGAGPVHRYTPTLPAYEALLRARYHLQKWTFESLAKGREQLEQAIALDPGFGQAHIELGWCLFGLVTENRISPTDASALMRTHARRALAIDPSLREGHAVLGMVAVLDYDWDDAGNQFRLALARDPVSPVVRWFHGYFYLAPLGRMREAEAELERAITEDPLNLLFRVILGFFHVGTNRTAEAEAVLRQVVELDETYWLGHNILGALHFNRGLFDEAVSSMQRALALLPGHPGLIGYLAGALHRAGDEVTAEALVQKLGDGTAFGAPIGLVFYHFARGEFDRAADWFEKGIAQRDTRMPWIVPHLFGDRLTSSPHWDRLAKLMHLPESR